MRRLGIKRKKSYKETGCLLKMKQDLAEKYWGGSMHMNRYFILLLLEHLEFSRSSLKVPVVYSSERDCSLAIIPDGVPGEQGVRQFGWSLASR